MPICEICYEEVEKVYTCKECEIKFCKDCGDTKKMMCKWCLEEEEEEPTLKCDYCGEEEEDLYECKECGALFCSECGNPRRRLCKFCLED